MGATYNTPKIKYGINNLFALFFINCFLSVYLFKLSMQNPYTPPDIAIIKAYEKHIRILSHILMFLKNCMVL